MSFELTDSLHTVCSIQWTDVWPKYQEVVGALPPLRTGPTGRAHCKHCRISEIAQNSEFFRRGKEGLVLPASYPDPPPEFTPAQPTKGKGREGVW